MRHFQGTNTLLWIQATFVDMVETTDMSAVWCFLRVSNHLESIYIFLVKVLTHSILNGPKRIKNQNRRHVAGAFDRFSG